MGPVADMVGEGGVGIASAWDIVAEEGVETASTKDTVAEVVDRVGWVERLGGATEVPSSSRILRTLQYSVRKELNKEFEHTQSALNLRHQT